MLNYPILVKEGLLQDQKLWRDLSKGRVCCVVTDEHVAPLYLKELLANICHSREGGNPVDPWIKSEDDKYLILPAGESHKSLETLTKILTHLTDRHFPRDGVLIALGGGVIGDMAGFAASIYQRGVDFIQVPTTTLAMLDSSVGGKTAVNLGSAKNNIGAFHQPIAVVMDLLTLKSLPDREYMAGLSEAIKHGLIQDAAFFAWIIANQKALAKRDPPILVELIQRSCTIKANIVVQDEKEQNLRMLLNFGHTFGHAIEAYSDYKDFKHGEAIAIGMMCALRFAKADPTLIEQTQNLLQAFHLPTALPKHYAHEKLRELMQHDKKKRDGLLNLVIVKEAGKACIIQEELCKIHF